jgi:hypothetical protein
MMHGLLGYIGPETILPLASVLAAIGGALMLTGRSILRLVRRCFCGLFSGFGQHDATQPEDAS